MCSSYDFTLGKNAFRCGTKWAYNEEVREGKQGQKEREVNLLKQMAMVVTNVLALGIQNIDRNALERFNWKVRGLRSSEFVSLDVGSLPSGEATVNELVEEVQEMPHKYLSMGLMHKKRQGSRGLMEKKLRIKISEATKKIGKSKKSRVQLNTTVEISLKRLEGQEVGMTCSINQALNMLK